jgi:hypothetical protein
MVRPAFYIKLLVFILPMVVLVGSAFFIALYSGEALPPRFAYETQASSPGATYMTSHRQNDFLYKYAGFDTVRPEVLFLGASRVLAFRAGFLNRDPSAAYNAALPGRGLPDLEAFVDQLTPDNAPKIMLFQIDQFWLNADWPTSNFEPYVDMREFRPDQIVMETRQLIHEMLTGQIALDQLLRRSYPGFGQLALGVDAIRNGDAFATDGAIQIVPRERTWLEQKLKLGNALLAVSEGNGHYLHGDIVNEEALDQLGRIIDKAAALNIEVIGFAPGYMPTLYDAMMDSGQYTYLEKAMPRAAALFEDRGFHFFDFTDMSGLIRDEEMEDGNHVFEIGALKLYMRMVEGAPELLGPYSDLNGLQQMLDAAPTMMEVVPREYWRKSSE